MTPKKSPHITFLVLREAGHPSRELRLKAWQLRALLGGAVVLVGALLFLVVISLGRGADAVKIGALREENQRLRSEIRVVEGRIGELESSLRQVDEFQRWTRNLANLEPLDEDTRAAGVGGPAGERLSSELAGVDRRLFRLSGQAQVLRQSAEEVLGTLREDRESLSRIPSIRPTMGGRLSSRYGRRVDPFTGQASFHRGIDLSARRGVPIVATADGRVRKVRRSSGGYGNMIVIDHGNGFETRYAHCERILVHDGQKVARGEMIATVGSTGHSTAPHLHYEVIKDGKSYNPSHYILSSDFIVD